MATIILTKRKDLIPGMYVKNLISGAIAMVRGESDKPGELKTAHGEYVAVFLRSKKAKRRMYPYWRVANVRIHKVEDRPL